MAGEDIVDFTNDAPEPARGTAGPRYPGANPAKEAAREKRIAKYIAQGFSEAYAKEMARLDESLDREERAEKDKSLIRKGMKKFLNFVFPWRKKDDAREERDGQEEKRRHQRQMYQLKMLNRGVEGVWDAVESIGDAGFGLLEGLLGEGLAGLLKTFVFKPLGALTGLMARAAVWLVPAVAGGLWKVITKGPGLLKKGIGKVAGFLNPGGLPATTRGPMFPTFAKAGRAVANSKVGRATGAVFNGAKFLGAFGLEMAKEIGILLKSGITTAIKSFGVRLLGFLTGPVGMTLLAVQVGKLIWDMLLPEEWKAKIKMKIASIWYKAYKGLAKFIGIVADFFKNIKQYLGQAVDWVVQLAVKIKDAILFPFKYLYEQAQNIFGPIIDAVKKWITGEASFSDVAELVWDAVRQLITWVFDAITSPIRAIAKVLGESAAKLVLGGAAVLDKMGEVWSKGTDAAGAAAAALAEKAKTAKEDADKLAMLEEERAKIGDEAFFKKYPEMLKKQEASMTAAADGLKKAADAAEDAGDAADKQLNPKQEGGFFADLVKTMARFGKNVNEGGGATFKAELARDVRNEEVKISSGGQREQIRQEEDLRMRREQAQMPQGLGPLTRLQDMSVAEHNSGLAVG